MSRILSYAASIREAIDQEMHRDAAIVLMGMGVDSPDAVSGTTLGLAQRFGRERVVETPISGDGLTGVAIGMALGGLRPIQVYSRMDVVLLAMNQLVNIAAKTRYVSGGTLSAPTVVRAIIGAGSGEGPQSSQALHALFMHIPGLKIVAPTTAYDAKGILTQAIRDPDPILFIEHEKLYDRTGTVPEDSYVVPLGKSLVVAEGEDISLVGVSWMTVECLRAREALQEVGIRAEVIDCLSLSPLDVDGIAGSVEKTRRILVVDPGWTTCGATAEILTRLAERFRDPSSVALHRMGIAAVPCPSARTLEDAFYPDATRIASRVYEIVRGEGARWTPFIKENLSHNV